MLRAFAFFWPLKGIKRHKPLIKGIHYGDFKRRFTKHEKVYNLF